MLLFRIVHITTDAASEVILTSSLPTRATVSADTEVMFVCIGDSNPLPTLSIIRNGDIEEEVAQQNTKNLTVSLILTNEQNVIAFMCRANGSDPVFLVDSSDKYTYNVECKYLDNVCSLL